MALSGAPIELDECFSGDDFVDVFEGVDERLQFADDVAEKSVEF